MSRKVPLLVLSCLLWASYGCGDRPAKPAPQASDDWRKHWVELTRERPIAVNRNADGLYDVRFAGDGQQAQTIITLHPANNRIVPSPDARLAAAVSFDPPTGARWVTFFDRFGRTRAHVMLPAMPAEAKKMFHHNLDIVVSNGGEAVVTLAHQPHLEVVPPADEYLGLAEMFMVSAAGDIKQLPLSRNERVQTLLPPRGGLALLRTRWKKNWTGMAGWTLERYAEGFALKWTVGGEAYNVHPAGWKYDVSLMASAVRGSSAQHEYLHFRPDGTLETEPLAPATQPATQPG